ncbi:MAG: FAD-dependent oxidoreductase [Thermoleophilia bacterium]|nr:FAD-dependent oxidoreductase [Thermoleophilia bacterium]
MTRPHGAIVIGAGLAGLSAAAALHREGWEVEVIEARDRVGGRTWSKQLPGGAVAEMGAEFILPGNTAVRSLASELGIGLWDKGVRYGRREPRGGIGTDRSSLDSAVETLGLALAGLPEDSPVSAAELLASLDVDAGAREVMLARAEISTATPGEGIPARDLSGVAHINDEPSPSVAGGNQNLSLGLADLLEDRVKLGDPAASIKCGSEAVEVATAGGHTSQAEHCVVSVPATVIDRIEFSPALPVAKAAALEQVQYGHAAKLLVPLAEPVPAGAVLNVPERYWCWTETGENDRPTSLVSCFAGSSASLDALEVGRGPERWLQSLASLRPDLRLETDQAILSTWDDDPWVGAAYSVSPSSTLSETLRHPVGPIAFAGEHTAGDFSGLMEGAVRSGLAAAGRLIGSDRDQLA